MPQRHKRVSGWVGAAPAQRTAAGARRLALLALLLLAPPAAAHRLDLLAEMRPGAVRVTVGYDDGTPAAGAAVTLRGAASLDATADAAGECGFEGVPPGEYALTADDRAGHRATAAIVVPASGPAATAGTGVALPRLVAIPLGLAVIALTAWLARRASRPA